MSKKHYYETEERLIKCKRIAEAVDGGLSIHNASIQFGVSAKSYKDWLTRYVKCACNMFFDGDETLEAHRRIFRHQ